LKRSDGSAYSQERKTLDFGHWTSDKALLSFQERLGEVSTKKWTLDFGHQTLNFERIDFLFCKISLYPSQLYSNSNKQTIQSFRTAHSSFKT
jgi:hypothetical protein